MARRVQTGVPAFHSVRDVGSQVGTNNATIVRFAQSLGYNGYPEFQSRP